MKRTNRSYRAAESAKQAYFNGCVSKAKKRQTTKDTRENLLTSTNKTVKKVFKRERGER